MGNTPSKRRQSRSAENNTNDYSNDQEKGKGSKENGSGSAGPVNSSSRDTLAVDTNNKNNSTNNITSPGSEDNSPTSPSSPITPRESILLKPSGFGDSNGSTEGLSPSGLNLSLSFGGSTPNSFTNANDRTKTLDIDDMIQRLIIAGYSSKVSKSVCLKNAEISSICQTVREIFLSQPTLIELSPPVKIVGDVHGQYSDLIRLFEMCGFPPAANYLFLGDYVDRGKQSLETILLLLCYKIKYPENFFLLRGNHECANVTRGKLNENIY